MKEQKFTLAAGELVTRALLANHIKIVTAESDLKIKARMSDMRGGRRADSVDLTLRQGKGITLSDEYDTWDIQSMGAGSQNVVIVLGRGKYEDGEVSGTVTADIKKSESVTPLADANIPAGSSAQVAAADLTRRELHITNQGAAAIRWGDASVSILRGGIIYPGQTAVIESAAEIHVFNTDVAAAAVGLIGVHD